MTQLGTAMRMYMPQSLKASSVHPGQVHFEGSWLRVCITQQLTMRARLVACTASQAMAAPSRPKPNLQAGEKRQGKQYSCGSEVRSSTNRADNTTMKFFIRLAQCVQQPSKHHINNTAPNRRHTTFLESEYRQTIPS
jgi:hypothetical protein